MNKHSVTRPLLSRVRSDELTKEVSGMPEVEDMGEELKADCEIGVLRESCSEVKGGQTCH
jgi:hypothetical protein